MSPISSSGQYPPSHVRVALVGCSGLLGDIIRKAVQEDPSIDVVAHLDATALSGGAADRIDADLVLWHNADEGQISGWLSAAHASPRVLATVADGRGASLWELRPHRTELGAVSPTVLVETIRAGVSQPVPHPTSQERPWPKN